MSAAFPSSPGLHDSVEARILDAALVRFGEFGVKKTTIEDIARQAGVDRVTVYRRIGSRDDVVQAVASREVAAVLTELDAISARHTDLGDLMAEFFVMVMTRWREHPLANRMLALEPDRILPKITIEGTPVFAMSVAAIHTALCRAADAGLLTEPPDLLNRAEVVCRIVHSFVLGPQGMIPIDSDEDLADFARTYLVPIVTG
ncbi:TetR/AcrR family transcriptional regulator [Nocardia donostiensis]|uniref:TetR family transcriptional regulator n=1 Tax=Nocardia donostiensis TaxID=1538463 RepID=A0A1V2TAC9_9NOCA|nr:TetR/AcrR family transcriptional regulator [Nocardia donostiensis]ONM46472.1 TetR family transcriptional regulator [Nocardia donostiensis]OQS18127.1 TetR family transcriptional regulator [Nocardia donostiensis]